MPKYGDVREDRFVYAGGAWHSPEAWERRNRYQKQVRHEHNKRYARGTRRADGFISDGYAWMSPEAWQRSNDGSVARAQKCYGWARLPATNADAGKATELFVRADLLARGLKVTYPDNINGEHDIHTKIKDTWYTIQVKSARILKRSGQLRFSSKKKITSDILALVYLPTRQLLYVSNKTEVPIELDTDLTIICSGGIQSRSSSLNPAPVVTTTKSVSSSAKSSKSRAKSVAAYSKSNSAGRRPSRSGNTAKET